MNACRRSRSAFSAGVSLWSALAVAALLPLTGCYGIRRHAVDKVSVAPHVRDATVDELMARLAAQYSAVQSLTVSLQVSGSEGDEHSGEVKEFPTVSGYLFMRKPAGLRLQLRLPVVMSTAFDMVSDGKTFKAYIPPQSQAFTGTDTAVKVSKKGFKNLRPAVIRDALLIPPVEPDELVNPTNGSRLLMIDRPRRVEGESAGAIDVIRREGHKEMVEEPDYDLNIVRVKQGQVLETVRIVHISRIDLMPYEQDIYQDGNVVEKVEYSNYQKFGAVSFPLSIVITRPVEQYKVKLDLSKLTINPELEDDTFQLKIPVEGVKITEMP